VQSRRVRLRRRLFRQPSSIGRRARPAIKLRLCDGRVELTARGAWRRFTPSSCSCSTRPHRVRACSPVRRPSACRRCKSSTPTAHGCSSASCAHGDGVRTTNREAAPGLVAAFLRDDGFRRVGLVRHGADGPREELGAGLRMPFPATSSLAPTSSRRRERPPGCSLDQAGTYAPDPNSVRTARASNALLKDTVATP